MPKNFIETEEDIEEFVKSILAERKAEERILKKK